MTKMGVVRRSCSVLIDSWGHIGRYRAIFEFFRGPSVCPPHDHHTRTKRTQPEKKFNSGGTHARELDATVTALGSSALLLQVKVPELATGGLDDANLVGPRVVPIQERPSICRLKTTKLVSSDRIQCRIRQREFFQRTGSGGAGQEGQHSALSMSIEIAGNSTHVLQSVVRHCDCG